MPLRYKDAARVPHNNHAVRGSGAADALRPVRGREPPSGQWRGAL